MLDFFERILHVIGFIYRFTEIKVADIDKKKQRTKNIDLCSIKSRSVFGSFGDKNRP